MKHVLRTDCGHAFNVVANGRVFGVRDGECVPFDCVSLNGGPRGTSANIRIKKGSLVIRKSAGDSTSCASWEVITPFWPGK